jgi:Holliday junction resolvase RusA-like endonuclease
MSDSIVFTIPGVPVAKGRAKFARRGNFVTTYTPDKTARYENLVKLAAQDAMGDVPPFETSIELRVMAYMPIPASWSMKKQRAAALGEITPISRPDLDNIVKAIKDGCNTVAWKDDSQVIDLIAKKRYGAPRVEIEIVRI